MCWRKGWDSNPRYGCPYAGFQDRSLKPLDHPSATPRLVRSGREAAEPIADRRPAQATLQPAQRGGFSWLPQPKIVARGIKDADHREKSEYISVMPLDCAGFVFKAVIALCCRAESLALSCGVYAGVRWGMATA
jgi:hypothetical protein